MLTEMKRIKTYLFLYHIFFFLFSLMWITTNNKLKKMTKLNYSKTLKGSWTAFVFYFVLFSEVHL